MKMSLAVKPRVFQIFLFADPFRFRKTTIDPHLLAHVNIEGPDIGIQN